MGKRRSHKRKSSSWDPISPLVDIAGGLAMGVIAAHMEEKYHYTEKGKINPYAVSAIGIGTGTMKTNRDIMRAGAWLGAMGSFDVEPGHKVPQRRNYYIPEDPIFKELNIVTTNDNRYAWRMNCEDGSSYGIYPKNYETKAQYNAALKCAKGTVRTESVIATTSESTNLKTVEVEKVTFVRISRLDNGANEYYLTKNEKHYVGEAVVISLEEGDVNGIILSIEKYPSDDIPQKLKDVQLTLK